MATWSIEQKTEVWYRTEVEADTFEEAIELANESGDWYRSYDDPYLTDNYWGENQDTEEQFTRYEGSLVKEAL